MNKQDVIDKYAARLLMVSFFLPSKWQIYVVVASSLYFVIRTLYARQWPPKANYVWAFFLGSGLLLYLFSVPLTSPEYRKVLLHLCEREESLLLMPLAFGIMSPYFRELIIGERVFFIYACLISCVAGNADYVYRYLYVNGGFRSVSHVQYRIIFESFTGIHPTYMGMFLAFSICILLLSDGFKMRRGVLAKYALMYVLGIFFFIPAGKIAPDSAGNYFPALRLYEPAYTATA